MRLNSSVDAGVARAFFASLIGAKKMMAEKNADTVLSGYNTAANHFLI